MLEWNSYPREYRKRVREAENGLKSNVLADLQHIHNKKIQNERRAVVIRAEGAVARRKLEVNVTLLLPIILIGNITSRSFQSKRV